MNRLLSVVGWPAKHAPGVAAAAVAAAGSNPNEYYTERDTRCRTQKVKSSLIRLVVNHLSSTTTHSACQRTQQQQQYDDEWARIYITQTHTHAMLMC